MYDISNKKFKGITMRNSKSLSHTSHDVKFDSQKRRCCAFDGCRIALAYTDPEKHQVLNDRRYCSLKCLKKQYNSLGFKGAIHIIHQTFGPDHPVTKVIQELRDQHKKYNKEIDAENKVLIGALWENENFEKLNKKSDKCL